MSGGRMSDLRIHARTTCLPEHVEFIQRYGDRHIRNDSYRYYRSLAERGLAGADCLLIEARNPETGLLAGLSACRLAHPTRASITVVADRYRNQGLGSMLFALKVDEAQRQGYEVETDVAANNIASRRLVSKRLNELREEDGTVVYAQRAQ